MDFTFQFIQLFFIYISFTLPLLLSFIMLIVILGQLVGHIEKWSRFDALYWTFITALTIGYGDIKPIYKNSRLISIIIGLLGIMLTGLIVAITLATATAAFESLR
jgi:voltage-gated potassium channel